jgi:hypothetical protein
MMSAYTCDVISEQKRCPTAIAGPFVFGRNLQCQPVREVEHHLLPSTIGRVRVRVRVRVMVRVRVRVRVS